MAGNLPLQITRFEYGSPHAPSSLRPCTESAGGSAITLIGDQTLLDRKPIALFCSVKCPGDLILKSYDLARALRVHPITLIGGFQSPIEKEFLELLLRRPVTQPGRAAPPSPSVIICPARGLAPMRIPRPWRDPIAAGRLLLLSTFPDTLRRPTAASASRRNVCVADLAHRILILHAAQGGKTEALCRQAIAAAKPVYTLPSPHNAHLIALGAQPVLPDDPSALVPA